MRHRLTFAILLPLLATACSLPPAHSPSASAEQKSPASPFLGEWQSPPDVTPAIHFNIAADGTGFGHASTGKAISFTWKPTDDTHLALLKESDDPKDRPGTATLEGPDTLLVRGENNHDSFLLHRVAREMDSILPRNASLVGAGSIRYEFTRPGTFYLVDNTTGKVLLTDHRAQPHGLFQVDTNQLQALAMTFHLKETFTPLTYFAPDSK